MSLSHGILGFLTYGEMSGYDLAKAFGSSIDFFWHAQSSQIYLELNKLEKKAFVSCRLIMQTDKPNKKLYTITEMGKKEFLEWLASGNSDCTKEFKNALLMKVFFSGNTAPAQCIAMLEAFIVDCQNYLASMKKIPDVIKHYSQTAEPVHPLYWQLTADYGRSYIQMNIDWAKRSIAQLEVLT